jgi:hypothetical protein
MKLSANCLLRNGEFYFLQGPNFVLISKPAQPLQNNAEKAPRISNDYRIRSDVCPSRPNLNDAAAQSVEG